MRQHHCVTVLLGLLLAGLAWGPTAHAQDPAGMLFFSSAAYTANETGGAITITVFRSNGDDDGNISVGYATAGGSATPGSDFQNTSGTLQWPDGDDNPRSFQVQILDDSVMEGSETFAVTLFNPTGGASLGSPATATVTISDDDSGPGGGTCTATANAMCLNGGRFRVSGTFNPPGMIGGDARAVQLTGDTGYFWFFNAENVELVVKVIDGCAVNGRYWVFAGGLTNVEFELTVEDTERGGTRTYTNPQRTAFLPIQDTRAFLTCP
ncbi:MAG: Calx-beta domain-containing protein [Acidobacteriota bacterium]|nr:Calx-beta domain-containing protein [Acidobacteriota bacterium]